MNNEVVDLKIRITDEALAQMQAETAALETFLDGLLKSKLDPAFKLELLGKVMVELDRLDTKLAAAKREVKP